MVKKAAEATPNHLLRAARKERGWTQKGVADRIGAALSLSVSRWESGTAFPSAHFIEQLCLLFGKSPRELGLLHDDADTSAATALLSSAPTQDMVASASLVSSSLWNVPYRRNPFFTGREDLLKLLHDKLTTESAAALTQSQALSGLGGIGKTQLAVEYAYRYRDAYRAIFWVRAASRDTLIVDFVSLASLLALPEQGAQDQQLIVAAVKRWLTFHKEWLLILDNADDLLLASDFLPVGGEGHILLTTRAQATGTIAPGVAVEKMESEEGILLLLRRAKVLAPDASLETVDATVRAKARAIVLKMDGLPLALDQAGAYIEETGCGLSEYLDLYQQRRMDLLKRPSSVSSEYPHTVASTWSLSFQQVERTNRAAGDLLRLCAFLDPDAIPEELITAGAPVLDPPLQSVAADVFELHEAMEALRKFSLVRRNPDLKVLTIHRLVQVVLKHGMDEQSRRQWAERTVRAVNAAFPKVSFVTWDNCRHCLPHVLVCAELIEQYSLSFPEAGRLLNEAGWYLRERAMYTQAESLLRKALTLREQVLGPEHPDTATTLNYLAQLVEENQGKYAQAEPLYLRSLTIREQALGPEHPDTADTLDNLAILYYFQGKYAQAEPLHLRTLAIKEKALGPEHSDTADTLNNLALLYHRGQGKYTQAEPLYQRALAIYVKVLGPEHPYNAAVLDNLAQLYQAQGKYAQAESCYQQALAIREQTLGAEHPHTATTLNNLGRLYQAQGKYAQSEPLYQRALAIDEHAMGPEHPRTIAILNNLALLYENQGKYSQAETLFQRALSIREKALGLEHPDTADTLDSLALLYKAQGQYTQAELLHLRALAVREKVLGPEHPNTATTLYNLALLYQAQGLDEQAKPLYQRALAIREQVLGPQHPDTADILDSLALLYQAQGQYTQAEPLHQRALAIRENVQGP